jgi:hypothetical protein
LVQNVEKIGQVVFLSFKHPQTGAVDRQPFSVTELENRFEIIEEEAIAFRAEPECGATRTPFSCAGWLYVLQGPAAVPRPEEELEVVRYLVRADAWRQYAQLVDM